jgi:hypothetical protein
MSRYFALLLVSGLFLATVSVQAAPPPGTAEDYQAAQTRILDFTEYINANKLLMFTTNVGAFAKDYGEIFGKTDGLYYPYESIESIQSYILTNTLLYSCGLWLGGKVNEQTRVTVAEYSEEYGPGPITPGGSYQPDAFSNPAFRVYKLFKDSLEYNPNQDYLDWPVDQGAPVDGSGRPAMQGDQMLWTVFNDADPALHGNNSGFTEPLGIEVQQTIWAVDETGDDSVWYDPHPLIGVTQYGNSSASVSVSVVDAAALTGNDYMIITLGLASPDTLAWELHNLTLGGYLPLTQPEITIDGMHIAVGLASLHIDSCQWGPDPELRCLTGVNWGGSSFGGGIGLGCEFFGTSLTNHEYLPVEIRWVEDGAGQSGYCYRRDLGYAYDGYHPNQDITVWDISASPARQLNFAFVEYYDDTWESSPWGDPEGVAADSVWNPGEQTEAPPPNDTMVAPSGGREYFFVLNSDYLPVEDPRYAVDYALFGPPDADFDCLVAGWLKARSDVPAHPYEGEYLRVFPQTYDFTCDTFTFSSSTFPPQTTGPDGVSIYMEYKLYNKAGNAINDCYVSLWSDPDLGDPGDDLVGCDTLSDIHFCYNETPSDVSYGTSVPAVGYRLLYGPVVPSSGDTAYFDGRPVPGYGNLGMTSFAKLINGTDPQSAYETYNYMQGFRGDGSPYMFDGQVLKYYHSGDPVTQTGDLDGLAADRRMMCSMGPFIFNPGDSQYVLIKLAVGQGSDYLSSVTKLKEILNLPFDSPSCCLNRGDLNHSGGAIPADISDLTYLVDYMFVGGPPPVCYEEGDLNASGFVDISDLTYLVDFIFRGGPPPMPCQ